jgi:hypothetical protein
MAVITTVSRNLYLYFYFFFLVVLILAELFKFPLLFYVCPPLALTSLTLYFYSSRKNNKDSVSQLVYLAFGILVFAYFFYFPSIRPRTETYLGWIFMIANLLFTQLFRYEGTVLFASQRIHVLHIIIPILFCFGFVGLNLTVIPDSFYALCLIYSTQKIFFYLTSLYRPVNKQSYYWVIAGMYLGMISDAGFVYHIVFIKESHFNIAVVLPYLLAQYFIIKGVLLNNRVVELKGIVKLKRFFQTFFSI